MEFKEVDALNNLKFRMETIIEDAYLRGYDAGYDKGHFAGINTRQKWAKQAKRGKEHRDKMEKMFEERQKCDTCYHNETEFSVCQYCTNGNKYEERQTEIKCDTCKYEDSSFSPCIKCKDNSEFKPKEELNAKDDYVDAIVKVRVPKWQIGEKVNLYFKDTMSMDGICEADKK